MEERRIFPGWVLLGTRKSLAPSGLDDVKIGVWYSRKPNLLISFLINEINEQSKNETLNANVSLIINNANLAGQIAKSFYN